MHIEEAIKQWKGSPYFSGGNTPLGCDCVGFVCGITGQVTGIRYDIARVPRDSFFSDPASAKAGLKRIMKMFPGTVHSLPLGCEIQPGDWLVATHKGSPGHIGIVVQVTGGTGIAYHCSEKSKKVAPAPFFTRYVNTNELRNLDGFKVTKIYRLEGVSWYGKK